MFGVESALEEVPESTDQLIIDRDIQMLGGITYGTDSYFPPEVVVRLVRLVPNRDCVS